MNSKVKLSIVFLNFNKITETQQTCLQLAKLTRQRQNIEVIAVDNGSSDGTAEFLRSQNWLKSILLKDNNGIAGYAEGFNAAEGEFLLVLDDDSAPHSLSGIDSAITTLDNQPEIGIIAANILGSDGMPQYSWHMPFGNQFAPSPFFIGCGFIIRRNLFEQIGWYPEDFFLYQNEIDVSFQVRLQGYEIFYDPDCVIVHRGKPSLRSNWRRIFFPTRNTLWLLRKYYPQPILSYMIISRILIGFIRACSFNQLKSYFQALQTGLFSPVNKSILPAEIRKKSIVFFYQNSIIHQLLQIAKSH